MRDRPVELAPWCRHRLAIRFCKGTVRQPGLILSGAQRIIIFSFGNGERRKALRDASIRELASAAQHPRRQFSGERWLSTWCTNAGTWPVIHLPGTHG